MHQHYPSPPIHQSHSPIYQPQMIHSHSPHQGFHNGNGNGNYLSNFHDPPLPRRPDSNQGMRGAMPSEWMGQRGPNGNSMDYAIAHQAIMNQGYAALNGRVIEDDM